MQPLIGVLPLWDDEKNSLWMLPGYFHSIENAGGLPVMLPLTTEEDAIQQYVTLCDGFLFTGGQDVSPAIYHCTPAFSNVICCPERDTMEQILLREALAQKKSILGICRGIQFLNACLGGTLYQDLPAEHPSDTEHHQAPPYHIPVHNNHIVTGSPLYDLLKTEILPVNSYHHQAVRTLAPVLKSMAVSEDGLIEAVYMPDEKFVWGVQWHPELSYATDAASQKVMEAFVASMKK